MSGNALAHSRPNDPWFLARDCRDRRRTLDFDVENGQPFWVLRHRYNIRVRGQYGLTGLYQMDPGETKALSSTVALGKPEEGRPGLQGKDKTEHM